MTTLVAALAALVLASPLSAQTSKPRFVALDAAAKERLRVEWDDDNPYQRERAYCLMGLDIIAGERFDVWRPHRMQRAPEPRAATDGVVPACPDSTQVVLHIHPPSWCEDPLGNICHLGGDRGYQCQPSPTDLDYLRRSKRVLDIVQCGPRQFVPYFRDGERVY